MFLEYGMANNLMLTLQNYNSGMRVAYTVQLVMTAWKPWAWAGNLGIIQSVLLEFLLYNYGKVILEVIGICEGRCAPPSQIKCYAKHDRVVVLRDAADEVVAK